MSKYHEVVYGNYKPSDYSKKLAFYIQRNYIKKGIVRFLDVGCGQGEYVKAFSEMLSDCEGIDSKINFNTDVFPYEDDSFDFIFCKSVIEHLTNIDHFLSEMRRILVSDGTLMILTPSWKDNMRWFYDDSTHIKPFCRKGLQDALRMANFKNVNIEYFYHLPLFWKYPKLKFIAKIIKLLPDDWRWKDWEQQHMNVFIRFCKEVQLMGIAKK